VFFNDFQAYQVTRSEWYFASFQLALQSQTQSYRTLDLSA